MKITWIGHSCFKIEQDGYSVVTDPYAPGSVPGLKDVHEQANLVLCSHGHGDHSYSDGVTLLPADTDAPQVTELHSWHDEVQGAKRGPNTMRVLDFGGVKAAHLGDIGCGLTEAERRALTGPEVLLIPVGGYYTIDGRQAASLVKLLRPRIVIPMHYRIPAAGVGYPVISTVNDFTAAMGGRQFTTGTTLNTDALPAADGETLVVVMTPQNRI